MPDEFPVKKPFLTRFNYQKLLGYQCNRAGQFLVKIYEGEPVMSDGSKHIIYGTLKDSDRDVQWDFEGKAGKPEIHRNNFGIWLVDPKTLPE